MLLGFVIAYWIASVAIGLWAASRVHNTRDFAIAGRNLPFYMVTATVFATWFGSETVLGIPATFLQKGLKGVVADPFGSSMCLILVGLFFAAPLYCLKLLTIGDYYRKRFGRETEVLTTLAIVISYLGWVGAQITALGLVFNVVSGGEISKLAGMLIGSGTILIYTYFGGMWAVAVTDLIQMIVIMLGMLYIGGEVSGMVGGVGAVVDHARAAGKLAFLPGFNPAEVIAFIAAWVTMMFGSIPQQDVFQRVQSAKTERIAVWASVLGGALYFCFAFVPMFLAYAATLIDPKLVSVLIQRDPQMILPRLVIDHAPLLVQVVFFGALLSAIKSCASATLLAPSVTFTENLLRPLLGPHLPDRKLLLAMRLVTLVFTLLVTLYAINSKASIFKMVENAYQITLVTAFVPLLCGVYWRQATRQGALLSIFTGLATWLVMLNNPLGDLVPAQFAGLLASALGMVAGSLLPQWIPPAQDLTRARRHELHPAAQIN